MSSKRISVIFYKNKTGSEPVREWLKKLSLEDRKTPKKEIDLAIKRMRSKSEKLEC